MTTAAACPKCGDPVEAGSRFCPSCGTDVTDAQSHAKTAMLSMADLEAQVLDLLVQETMGQFEILQELGRGGMAMVYLAHDISLNRKVAIKVMAPSLGADPDMAERFIREAQTAASLSHPNIIPVYAVKQTPDISYFVMKFISGRPLDSLMEELSRVPAPMAKTILSQVAAGLGYGHKKGIVHRDVKPGNIMLDEDGWAIVTDFGIAKVQEASSLTQTGAAIGTPTYMSPEQLAAADVTGASDQYSLGVLAYEMMSGRKPFDGESVVGIMYGHVHELPPPFLEEFPECTPELHSMIMRMMEKRAEDRFESMDAVISELGTGQLAPDDPVRKSIMALATEGMSAQLLEKIHTPRSPIPRNHSVATPRTRPATSPSARTVVVSDTGADPVPKKSSTKLVATIGGLVAVGAVVTAVVVFGPSSASDEQTPAAPPQTQAVEPAGQEQTPVGSLTLSIDPPQATLTVGEAISLTISGSREDGAALSGDVEWNSDNPSVATVNQAGVVTGAGVGSALIAAVLGESTARTTITVRSTTPGPARPTAARASVASIGVSPASGEIRVGGTLRIIATPLDENRRDLGGRQVQWTSSNPAVATVRDGLVSGIAPGRATVSALAEGRTADVPVVVSAVPVARILVSLGSASVAPNASTRARADLLAADGSALSGRTVRWATSDAGIASVSDGGSVTGVGPGVATITATSEGQSGSASITVNAPVAQADPLVDPRQGIAATVQEYARSLESEDISRVRLVFPRISSAEENNWRTAWDAWSNFTVTLSPDDIQINGDNARVNVSGTYAFRSRSGDDELPVNIQLNMERRGDAWVITSVR